MKIILEITFKCTCAICPEQYDVYINNSTTPCGYVRLRWGKLSAYYNNKLIYTTDYGDNFNGSFDNDCERQTYLKTISDVIAKEVCKEQNLYYSNIDINYDIDSNYFMEG